MRAPGGDHVNQVSAPTVSDALTIQISRREVLRNLGYPRARDPSPQVAAAWDEAAALVRPRGIHRVVEAAQAAATGMPRPTELVGLGICTIGPALEQAEASLGELGQVLDALILDAFGSAAAEAAADALNVLLCQEAQERGYQLPPRISPGYGRWDIRGQTELTGLLGAEAIGIRLTEGLMMVPRKSVSFAVRFERELSPTRVAHNRCAACDLARCAFRVTDENDEQEEP
jgi:hypothetical protein